MIAEVERLESLDVVGVLAKPFDPATLGGKVRAALEKSAASRRAPPAPAAAALPKTLDDLRNAFVKTSLEKAERAKELVARLEAQPKDDAAREELMRFFHSLAGIGASHGFVQVTALAKEGELECMALKRSAPRPARARSTTGSASSRRWCTSSRRRRRPPIRSQAPAAAAGDRARRRAERRPARHRRRRRARASCCPCSRPKGFRVSEAGSLKDARAALADERALPSAVVVDVDLPDGSGHELIVEIRAPVRRRRRWRWW